MTRHTRVLAAALLLVACAGSSGLAQESTEERLEATALPEAAPVYLRGRRVFDVLHPIGPYSASDRAASISARLEKIAADPSFDLATITARKTEWGYEIIAGDERLAVLVLEDARASGETLEGLAARAVAVLPRVLAEAREEFTPEAISASLRRAGLATVALLLFLALSYVARPALGRALGRLEERVVGQGATFAQRTLAVMRRSVADLLRLAGAVLLLAACVGWLLRVLVELPWTRPFGRRLLPWTLDPLQSLGREIADYLPNLVYVAAIGLVTHVIVRFFRLFFDEIARGHIRLGGFEPEWAVSTYRIARFFVLAFALVAMFPYLPGSGSEAFRGISLMVGVLVSLGSSSAVSNVIAGLMLQYTRAFRIGDVVKIGEATGRVLETRLMTTRVLTLRNERVSIPNGMVLGGQVVNYSAAEAREGPIIQIGVTIGYDVPWRKVHELLVSAARTVASVRAEPAPVVVQTGLNDFSVAYELDVHVESAMSMRRTRGALHEAIQDRFAEAGVEILSPAYAAVRDGNRSTLPSIDGAGRGPAPPFRVRLTDEDTQAE